MKMPEKVSLICDFDALPDIFVHTDPKRVTQVLSNLISNAVKFTEVGSIRFSYRIVEKYVLVEVIDTGIGISPQHQQAIFDRFVKVNSFKQGTGLGLTICKTIIEALNGTIGVDSCAVLVYAPLQRIASCVSRRTERRCNPNPAWKAGFTPFASPKKSMARVILQTGSRL